MKEFSEDQLPFLNIGPKSRELADDTFWEDSPLAGYAALQFWYFLMASKCGAEKGQFPREVRSKPGSPPDPGGGLGLG